MEKFIRENYQTMKLKDIAEHLGISVWKVKDTARRMNIRKFESKPWTEEEITFLADNFPEHKGKWCAERLGRGFHATHKMAEKLGIKAEWNYIYMNLDGYLIDCTDRDNKVYVHRKVMEEHLGRKLDSSEIVHHIDGNKQNNDISNLQIVNRSDHMNMHREDLLAGKENKI